MGLSACLSVVNSLLIETPRCAKGLAPGLAIPGCCGYISCHTVALPTNLSVAEDTRTTTAAGLEQRDCSLTGLEARSLFSLEGIFPNP